MNGDCLLSYAQNMEWLNETTGTGCPVVVFTRTKFLRPSWSFLLLFTWVGRVSRVRPPWPPTRCRRLITQNSMHVLYYQYRERAVSVGEARDGVGGAWCGWAGGNDLTCLDVTIHASFIVHFATTTTFELCKFCFNSQFVLIQKIPSNLKTYNYSAVEQRC